jgi:phenylacetate-CoA ligase
VVRRVTGPLYDRLRFGGELARAAAELARTDRAAAEEVARLRERRLAALLAHAAAHVPWYGAALARAGVRAPGDAAALAGDAAAFARLPLLEKEDLRRAAADLRARDRPRPARLRRTSGSTGRPVSVLVDARSAARHRAAKSRARGWLGVRPCERWAMLWGRDEPRSRLHAAAVELSENRRVFHLADLEGPGGAPRISARLARFDPALLYGYSSGLARLASLSLERGLAPPPSLRVAVATAEMLPEADRRRISRALGVPVALEYGLTEAQFVAGTCDAGSLHVAEENVLVEVLDGGRPAPPGRAGEIVVTDLHGLAAPLIRFRTGDTGALLDGPCPCGRAHRRLDLRIGRSCDLILLDGRAHHPEVFTLPHDFPHFERVARFRVLRTAERAFTVEVVPAGDGPFEPVAAALARSARESLGPSVSLEVRAVPDLPRDPSGKLRYYLDARGTGAP